MFVSRTVVAMVAALGALLAVAPNAGAQPASAAPTICVEAAETPNEVLLFGGSGNPEGHFVENLLDGSVVPPNSNITRVRINADFWPAFGGITGLSYDDSRALSIPEAADAIRAAIATCRPVLLVDYSQSGSTVSLTLQKLAIEGDDLSRVRAMHISNPKTVVSGLEARVPWFRLPGITATGPAPETPGVDVCRKNDPICNAPCTFDAVNLGNLIAGYLREHPDYYGPIDPSQVTVYEQNGRLYITIDDGTVPLIEQLQEWGIDIPVLNAWIKERISTPEVHGPRGTCPSLLGMLGGN